MITKPTVLVLGAGASEPYEYPLGGELLEIICNQVGNTNWTDALRQCGVEQETIKNFKSELYKSHQPSVDAFLERRPEFRDVGKLAIVFALLQKENETILDDFKKRKEGFYDYLFSQLSTPSLEEFGNNKLSIITFNYDRSLEHFLFRALKSSYGKADDLTTEVLSSIPIIHVHGTLGPLPWQEKDGRPYKIMNTKAPDETAIQIENASRNILIVSEAEESTDEFNQAFECLKSARRIYFLGFGFHNSNLKKLKFRKLHICDNHARSKFVDKVNAKPKTFRGSAKGWRTTQRNSIERNWGIGLPDGKLNDLEFLKEYAELDLIFSFCL